VQPAGYGTQVGQDPADVIAERDAVRHTIAQLPESLRLCLLLSVVGGLSSREIARSLDLSEVAVRQRLSRARKLFQQLYLQESGETLIEKSTMTRKGANCGHAAMASSHHRVPFPQCLRPFRNCPGLHGA
jgi:hypothetical protein